MLFSESHDSNEILNKVLHPSDVQHLEFAFYFGHAVLSSFLLFKTFKIMSLKQIYPSKTDKHIFYFNFIIRIYHILTDLKNPNTYFCPCLKDPIGATSELIVPLFVRPSVR